MSGQLQVVTPACTVYLADGSVTLLYQGSPLPESSEMRDGEAERLTEGGFVSDASSAKKPAKGKSADSE